VLSKLGVLLVSTGSWALSSAIIGLTRRAWAQARASVLAYPRAAGMTSLRLPGHLLPLLLLLYVTADFMDPSIPGVFFFDNDVLFVDGAIQFKSDASTDLTPTEPIPFGGQAYCDDENATAKARAIAQPSRSQRVLWKNLKHDDSASFASSSPPDSSPTPPQS
jgi:hypothetical protein